MPTDIETLPCEADRLGESPIWDDREGCLYWVDIVGPRIRRFDPITGPARDWTMPLPVGSIGLTDRPGHLIAALKDGFYDVDLASGAVTLLARPETVDPAARFNDGKVDRQGRFVSGTLVPHGAAERGHLYRLNPDLSVDRLDSGAQISNALSFSLDGRTMYYADSLQRAIWAFDYDPASGAASGKRVLIDTAPLKSAPDGACMDADDCLWVALWDGWSVRRYAPDGTLLLTVGLPCARVTKIAFGGPDLRTAYVTTARTGLDAAALTAQPLAGALFAFDSPVAGIPLSPVRLS